MVPVHLTFIPFLTVLCNFRLYFALCLLLVCVSEVSLTFAQTIVNGQIFTNALAILDSPQPNTPLPLAIDVSGNGKLLQAASFPNSGLSTSFDSLEVYLVSFQTSLNLTVSSGPGLLSQESGSTVKHINWPIPACVPSGLYNLTIYEGSHIDGVPSFAITPLPIQITNDNANSSCTNDTNPLLPQSQISTRGQSPWLDPSFTVSTPTFPTASIMSSGMITQQRPAVTMPATVIIMGNPTDMAWPLTLVPSGLATTVYALPSPSGSDAAATTVMGDTTFPLPPAVATCTAPSGICATVTATATPIEIVFVTMATTVSTQILAGSTQIVQVT
ncbi:hypothetical protein K474DRAFT_1591678 [Panus rudis PR-1116 ss-1]|nr:hypothetical protein K474DRAFT_1591678 [Panus rudis PR-1116 ss-1]